MTMAANAAIGAPLIIFVLNLMFGGLKSASPTDPAKATTLIQGLLLILFLIAGVVSAVYVLIASSRYNSQKYIGRTVAGLVINLIFVSIFITNFSRGADKRLKAKEELAKLESTSRSIQEDMRKDFDQNGTITVGNDHLDRLQNQFQEAGKNMSGQQKLVMQASASYTRSLQVETLKYERAMVALQDAKVLSPAGLDSLEKFKERRAVVENFITVNKTLKAYLANAEANYRKELAAHGLSETLIDEAIKGFSASASKRQPFLMEIRDCDDRLGKAILGSLDVLEDQFGKWKIEPNTGRLLFNDDTSIEKYNHFMEEIDQAADAQAKAQEKLVNLAR